jgi:uncharacterized protein DUF481
MHCPPWRVDRAAIDPNHTGRKLSRTVSQIANGGNRAWQIGIKGAIVSVAHLKNCFIFLLCILLVGARVSAASDQHTTTTDSDVIVPKTGHPLFGAFQGTTDTGISFVLDSGSAITPSWEKVEELKLSHKVMLKSKMAKPAKSASMEFDWVTIRPDQQNFVIVSEHGEMTIARSDVVSISNQSSAAEPDKVKWVGSIAPRASLITGTQGQQMLGGSLDVRRTAHPGKTDWHQMFTELQLDGNNTLATQAGSRSIHAHEYDGKFNQEVKLTKRLYANALASGYDNSSFNLYLEQTYGGGVGGRIGGERLTLELTGNLLYIGEHFYGNAKSVGFAGADLTEIYTIVLAHLKGGNLTLGETGVYIPAFNQQNAWQARGNANISVPIFKSFAWIGQFRDDYMENSPNLKKNWSTTSVGIVYTFHSANKRQ